jgi:hypothetical protein
LTEVTLSAAGVDNKDDRKLVMTALRKAGHVPRETPRKRLESIPGIPDEVSLAGPSSSPTLSTPSTVEVVVCRFMIKLQTRDVSSLSRHPRRRNGNGMTTSMSFCLMVPSMKPQLTEVWSSTKYWTTRFAAPKFKKPNLES